MEDKGEFVGYKSGLKDARRGRVDHMEQYGPHSEVMVTFCALLVSRRSLRHLGFILTVLYKKVTEGCKQWSYYLQ